MFQVLFVCTANICRSPYMELAARGMLLPGAEVGFSSAGTLGFVDSAMYHRMADTFGHSPEVTDEDIEAFRSRRLTHEMVEQADVVLTAEEEHRQFILLEQPTLYRKVFTLGQVTTVISRLAEQGDLPRDPHELLAKVAGTPGIAQIRADIADPYRRGSAAAAACALQIDEMLAVLVPALEGSPATSPQEEQD